MHRRSTVDVRRGRRAWSAALVALLALVASLLVAPPVAAVNGAAPGPAAPDVVGGRLLGTPGIISSVPAVPLPEVTALSYVIADATTGQVLAAKDAHRRLPPASTLKLLTALALLPVLDPTKTYLATYEDVAVEGSKVGIFEGGVYRVDQLFEALFLGSGNDAANSLASVAGGLAVTTKRMNATAEQLRALDTYAVNPHGLDDPAQLTSAYDLALIGRAALRREDVRRYAATSHVVFPGRDGATFEVWNRNRFLREYPGAIGLKNGYTTIARNTLVAAAVRDGRTLLVTVLGGEHRASEEAALLMDWGFANAAAAKPVGRLVEPGEQVQPTATASASAGEAAAGGSTPGSGDAVAGDAVAGDAPLSSASLPVLVLVGVAALGVVIVGLRAGVLVGRRRAQLRAGPRFPDPARRRPMR